MMNTTDNPSTADTRIAELEREIAELREAAKQPKPHKTTVEIEVRTIAIFYQPRRPSLLTRVFGV